MWNKVTTWLQRLVRLSFCRWICRCFRFFAFHILLNRRVLKPFWASNLESVGKNVQPSNFTPEYWKLNKHPRKEKAKVRTVPTRLQAKRSPTRSKSFDFKVLYAAKLGPFGVPWTCSISATVLYQRCLSETLLPREEAFVFFFPNVDSHDALSVAIAKSTWPSRIDPINPTSVQRIVSCSVWKGLASGTSFYCTCTNHLSQRPLSPWSSFISS